MTALGTVSTVTDAGGSADASKFYSHGLMDLSAYSVERTELDANWNSNIARSLQGTLFMRSEFCTTLDATPAPWICRKGNQIVGGALLFDGESGAATTHDLAIYTGLWFAPADPNQPPVQARSEEFRAACALVSHLAETYDPLVTSLHHTFDDLRPFLWHNYGDPGQSVVVDPRYTTSLVLTGEPFPDDHNDNPLYQQANKSRRQELRYGFKAGLVTEERLDLDLFGRLYHATFARQGADPSGDIAQMQAVTQSLADAGLARMFVTDGTGGDPASVAIFGVDDKRAYYLYGANDPAQRDEHCGTAVLWEAFAALSASGCTEIDLEGVNSPARGYFKLSWGGSIEQYHRVTLARTTTNQTDTGTKDDQ